MFEDFDDPDGSQPLPGRDGQIFKQPLHLPANFEGRIARIRRNAGSPGCRFFSSFAARSRTANRLSSRSKFDVSWLMPRQGTGEIPDQGGGIVTPREEKFAVGREGQGIGLSTVPG